MPSGWPSAMAPPLGLTCSASSGSPSMRSTAKAWAANASLSSITSICASLRPRRSSSLRLPGGGGGAPVRGGTLGGDLDSDDLGLEHAFGDGARGAALASKREGVLRLAVDLELLRHVLGRLG